VKGQESASDDRHKQECELQAAYEILPLIKQKFPRLPITLLTDSLYANEPLLKLCKQLGWNYSIVRQEGSLKKVAAQCDRLGKTDVYKKNYHAKATEQLKNGGKIVRTIQWFNQVCVGDEFTNVIRFEEITYDSKGNIALLKILRAKQSVLKQNG